MSTAQHRILLNHAPHAFLRVVSPKRHRHFFLCVAVRCLRHSIIFSAFPKCVASVASHLQLKRRLRHRLFQPFPCACVVPSVKFSCTQVVALPVLCFPPRNHNHLFTSIRLSSALVASRPRGFALHAP
ncbi:hypothetical protein TRVL_03371 [Trypanosoma vivax]|nr:hypothetical protein TRVL_03371 [Trypanosoma vivax]